MGGVALRGCMGGDACAVIYCGVHVWGCIAEVHVLGCIVGVHCMGACGGCIAGVSMGVHVPMEV